MEPHGVCNAHAGKPRVGHWKGKRKSTRKIRLPSRLVSSPPLRQELPIHEVILAASDLPPEPAVRTPCNPPLPGPSPAGLSLADEDGSAQAWLVGVAGAIAVKGVEWHDLGKGAKAYSMVVMPSPEDARKALHGVLHDAEKLWPGPRVSLLREVLSRPHKDWGSSRPRSAPLRGRPPLDLVQSPTLTTPPSPPPPPPPPPTEPPLTPKAHRSTPHGVTAELAALLDQLPDRAAASIAVLELLVDAEPFAGVLPNESRAVLRKAVDSLRGAVLADVPGPAAPFVWKSGATLSAATLQWMNKRYATLSDATSWREACTHGTARNELMRALAEGSKKKAGGGNLYQNTVQRWENLVVGLALRAWRGYTRSQRFRRTTMLMRLVNIRNSLRVRKSFAGWRCTMLNSRKEKTEQHSTQLLRGFHEVKERYEKLLEMFSDVEYRDREMRSRLDTHIAEERELRQLVEARKANACLFDLTLPFTDPSTGTAWRDGFIAFTQPTVDPEAPEYQEAENDPLFYNVWVAKGLPQVREPWTPERALSQWINDVVVNAALQAAEAEAGRPFKGLPVVPKALWTRVANATADKKTPSYYPKPRMGVPGPPVVVRDLSEMTTDVWITLLANTARDALVTVLSSEWGSEYIARSPDPETPSTSQTFMEYPGLWDLGKPEDKWRVVWSTLRAMECTVDITESRIRGKDRPLLLLLLTRVLAHHVHCVVLDEDDVEARAKAAHALAWHPPPDKPLVPPLRALVAVPGVDSTPIPSETPGGSVLLWASGQLQAAQTSQRKQQTPLARQPTAASPLKSSPLDRSWDLGSSRRSSAAPEAARQRRSPRVAANVVRMSQVSPRRETLKKREDVVLNIEPTLVWWSAIPSVWNDIDPRYRAHTFISGLDPGLSKLTALAKHLLSTINLETQIYIPPVGPGNEGDQAEFLLEVLSLIHPQGALLTPPIPKDVLSAASPEAKMIWLVHCFTAAWARQRVEAGEDLPVVFTPTMKKKGVREPTTPRSPSGRGSFKKVQRSRSLRESGDESGPDTARTYSRPARGVRITIEPPHVVAAMVSGITHEMVSDMLQTSDSPPPHAMVADTSRALAHLVHQFAGGIRSIFQAYCAAGKGFTAAAAMQLVKDAGLVTDHFAGNPASVRRGLAVKGCPAAVDAPVPPISASSAASVFYDVAHSREHRTGYHRRNEDTGQTSPSPSFLTLPGFVEYLIRLSGTVAGLGVLQSVGIPQNFRAVMVRAILPSCQHADMGNFLECVYSAPSQEVLRTSIRPLSGLFVAYSSCPTPNDLLDDRRMSRRQFTNLLGKSGLYPVVVHDGLVETTFTTILLSSNSKRRVVGATEPSNPEEYRSSNYVHNTTVSLTHLSFSSFVESLFFLAPYVVPAPVLQLEVQFEHFLLHHLLPPFECHLQD